jgi:outer membrane protein OmpA-like peptidoglycan-associated protein
MIQPKLTIGASNDKYEQEADRVADQVMRMPDTQVQAQFDEEDDEMVQAKPLSIQRTCEECGEELQRKPGDNTTRQATSNPQVESRIGAISGGHPLSNTALSYFEPRFGQDFSNVRIFSDANANRLARSVNARAFTVGEQVVFGQGQYQPDSTQGKRLMAHELTHVVQQGGRGKRIQRVQNHVLENDPNTAPAMSCPVATSSPAGLSLEVAFTHNSSTLTPGDVAAVDNFVNNWHLSGVTDPVRVDGYASKDGSPSVNWPLSCDRAEILANELMTPSSGAPGIPAAFIDIFANGETESFSTTALAPNRIATATIPTPIPPPPLATAAVFSESPAQIFHGYDNSVVPNFQVVPVGEIRIANVAVTPAGALPTFVSDNPAIATVRATASGIEVTGIADGATRIEARQGATVLDTLRIEVKAQRNITVDYHFMSDTARPASFFGLIPAQPRHQTARPPASAAGQTATLNRIWQRQANVQFTTGTVDSPVIPSNLGPQVVWTALPFTDEWSIVSAFATGGDWNVYLVWEYEQDNTPAVDNANAGTLGTDTLLEDNDCPDGLTLSHEAGHFLSAHSLPHTAAGIMGPCGAPNKDRARKIEADAVNL